MAYDLNPFTDVSASTPANADRADDVATLGSGDVFADLGFENPAEERLKADLVLGLTEVIEQKRLSQAEAGRLIGLSQPDVSKLLRGRTGGFSLERLLAFTRALGSDVEITVRRSDAERPGRVKLRVLETM